MLRKKNITLNGKKASGSELLKYQDQVKLFLSDETYEKFCEDSPAPSARCPLDIIYEDDNILLINKPVGMLSQPSREPVPSLVEYLTVTFWTRAVFLMERLPSVPVCATAWTAIPAGSSLQGKALPVFRSFPLCSMTGRSIRTICA